VRKTFLSITIIFFVSVVSFQFAEAQRKIDDQKSKISTGKSSPAKTSSKPRTTNKPATVQSRIPPTPQSRKDDPRRSTTNTGRTGVNTGRSHNPPSATKPNKTKVSVGVLVPIKQRTGKKSTSDTRSSSTYKKSGANKKTGTPAINAGSQNTRSTNTQRSGAMPMKRPDFKYSSRVNKVKKTDSKDIRATKNQVKNNGGSTKTARRPNNSAASGLFNKKNTDRAGAGDPGGNIEPSIPGGNTEPLIEEEELEVICCSCCGSAWCKCKWSQYCTPVFWCYNHYDPSYWNNFWYAGGINHIITEHHDLYDFVNTFPSIYSLPALVLDPEAEAIALLDEGADFFRAGKYLEALHRFRLAALTDLNFAIPKFAYAHTLFALGMYDYAAYEIRLGLLNLPEWLEIGGDLKLLYGALSDFDEQMHALFAHIKLFRSDENAILTLGYAAYFSGDIYLAEKAFKELATFKSQNSEEMSKLFLDAIDNIKKKLVSMGEDEELLKDDGVTLDELL